MSFYLLEGLLSNWRRKKAFKVVRDKKNILEIGCGKKAPFLMFLSKDKDKKLIGIDPQIDDKIIRPDNLILIKDNLVDKIDLADNSVDGVVMLAVLEHLDYPLEIINEVYRVLRPGGLICLTVPTPFAENILKFLSFLRFINPQMLAEHKRYFNKADLEKIAREAGFNKTKHQYFQLGCNNFFIGYKYYGENY